MRISDWSSDVCSSDLYHPNLQISNPFAEIKVRVMQNAREDNAWWVTRPVFVKAAQLVYNNVDVTDFYGGNEFRRFDLRSVRFRGEGVVSIEHDDLFIATLETDKPRISQAYSSLIDYNGNYFIRLQEGNEPETEADYVRVNFRLSGDGLRGDYYIFGALTDWQLNEDFRLTYDPSSRTWQASLLLKQGIYAYIYVHAASSGKIANLTTESNHYETENDSYIFVYYRRTVNHKDKRKE